MRVLIRKRHVARTRWRARTRSGALALLLAMASWPTLPLRAHAASRGYELWLGVLAHDVPIFGTRKEHGPDVNVELVLPSPVPSAAVAGISPTFRWLLQPRPDIGVDANTGGDTSQGYIGLVWTADLASDVLHRGDGLFFDVGLGPELNNGEIETSDPHHKRLGSHVLIHSSVQIGYRIDRAMSVALYLDHASDAGLSKENEGLTNLGIRFGVNF